MNGKELASIRKSLDLTQPELANLLNKSTNTIVNWEKKPILSKKIIATIVDFLNNYEPYNNKSKQNVMSYNQAGRDQNFLSESNEGYKTKRELELEEQLRLKTEELLNCKDQLIELLSKGNNV